MLLNICYFVNYFALIHLNLTAEQWLYWYIWLFDICCRGQIRVMLFNTFSIDLDFVYWLLVLLIWSSFAIVYASTCIFGILVFVVEAKLKYINSILLQLVIEICYLIYLFIGYFIHNDTAEVSNNPVITLIYLVIWYLLAW